MKPIFLQKQFLLLMTASLLLSSCFKVEQQTEVDDRPTNTSNNKDDPEENNHTTSRVDLITRSANTNGLNYPLHIFAFDESGVLCQSRDIKSETDNLSMTLETGTYSIVALAGTSSISIPKNPTINSEIDIPIDAPNAPEIGFANFRLGYNSTTVNIDLNYATASLKINLMDLPEDVSEVTTIIGGTSNKITFTGKVNSTSLQYIALEKERNTWKSNECFLVPGNSYLYMSISITRPRGTFIYSFSSSTKMERGIPYIINGAYLGQELELSGIFTSNEWGKPVIVDFTFGPGDNESLAPKNVKAGSIWNDHIVAFVDTISSFQIQYTLLSKEEWKDMTSALNETQKTTAFQIQDNYKESIYTTGWRIPSTEDAIKLRNFYSEDNLSKLNEVLNQANLTPISCVDDKDNAVRYLCEDAYKTFAFKTNSAVTAAGAKIDNYHLRLVKTLIFNY